MTTLGAVLLIVCGLPAPNFGGGQAPFPVFEQETVVLPVPIFEDVAVEPVAVGHWVTRCNGTSCVRVWVPGVAEPAPKPVPSATVPRIRIFRLFR
jgi:hypothetical protein